MRRSAIPRRQRELLQVLLACALGIGAAVLVSACGGSSAKLIPLANAEPLQNDFEAVAQAAESGAGNCSSTESALLKTEQDFGALPASVDSGLRARLREGIDKLREDALAKCEQHGHTTSTTKTSKSTPTKTQTTPTTSTTTQTTSTETQTTSPPTTTTPGGGTTVPEEETPSGGPAGGTGAGEESGTPGSGGEAGAGATGTPGTGNGQGAGSGTPGAGQLLHGRHGRGHRFDRRQRQLMRASQR